MPNVRIHDLEKAKEYLQNELLRTRLITICEALLEQDGNIREIMGSPDDKKVRSLRDAFSGSRFKGTSFSGYFGQILRWKAGLSNTVDFKRRN